MYSNGEILLEEQGRELSGFLIDQLKDSTHNRKYSCIGIVPGGTNQYVNFTVVAISEYVFHYHKHFAL